MAASLILSGCRLPTPAPSFDRSKLQVADILLYAPETFSDDPFGALAGGGIAAATRRYKSHVEIVYSVDGTNILTLGARQEGINIYPVRIDARLACVRRMPGADHFNKEAADGAVKEDLGKRYPVEGLFQFLLQPFIMPKAFIRVCSPLSAKYLRAGGLEPFNMWVQTSSVTPGDFFVTGVPVTIWRNAEIDRLKYPVHP